MPTNFPFETSTRPLGIATLMSMILDFVAPLVLVRPPHAGPDSLARRVDPDVPGGVLLEGDPAEPAGLRRMPRVVEIDRVNLAVVQSLREIDKHGASIALIFKRRPIEQNLVDIQRFGKVNLNARVVTKHPEANRILAADELLRGIDAHVESGNTAGHCSRDTDRTRHAAFPRASELGARILCANWLLLRRGWGWRLAGLA